MLALALSGCSCEAETEGLGLGDAAGLEVGVHGGVDSGVFVGCQVAAECPGNYPSCDDPRGCGCGTFKSCSGGACLIYSIDCPFDGGVADGGREDSSLGCQAPSECGPPRDPTVAWCGQRSAGAWSCVNEGCYWECGTSRTCKVGPGLTCSECEYPEGRVEQACRAEGTLTNFGAPLVEESTCGVPEGTLLEVFPGSRVSGALVRWNGNTLGQAHTLSDGRFLAEFPSLGGLCTGQALATGAYRVGWSCPTCEMVWVW